jgi:hypothetical protein
LNRPQYANIDGKMYKINTDFRVALECDRIARDTTIGDVERALAIIYKLFGDDGLKCKNAQKITEICRKYISLGNIEKSVKTNSDDKYKLDFEKCKGLIASSFKYDYNYNPYDLEYLHWYDFYNDLENLSNSELGDCCILNRIVNLFNYDTSKIKDNKERTRMNEAKETLRKRYCICEKEKEITPEQEESAKAFYKSIGIDI